MIIKEKDAMDNRRYLDDCREQGQTPDAEHLLKQKLCTKFRIIAREV
jgi:hypothetical protein